MKIEIEIGYTSTEAVKLFELDLNSIEDAQFSKIEQSGFDGLDILYYFIVTGTAIYLIKSFTQIIVKLIGRNDVKSFKLNNIECKGFSEKEIIVLLEKTETQLTPNSKRK